MINTISFNNKKIKLKKQGKPLSPADLALLEALEDKIDILEAHESMKEAEKNRTKSLDD